MCCGNVGAISQGLLSDDCQIYVLSAVIVVYLVAGFQFHAGFIGHESFCFSKFDALNNALSFGLGCVHEIDVSFAVIFHCSPFLCGDHVIAVFLFDQNSHKLKTPLL